MQVHAFVHTHTLTHTHTRTEASNISLGIIESILTTLIKMAILAVSVRANGQLLYFQVHPHRHHCTPKTLFCCSRQGWSGG